MRQECIGKRVHKSLEDTLDKPYYERMYKRVNTKTGAKMMRVRAATVEPVLGTLLHFVGMKKVYTKGIDLANKHVLLASTAYNVKKLLKFKGIDSGIKSVLNACIKGKDGILIVITDLAERGNYNLTVYNEVGVQRSCSRSTKHMYSDYKTFVPRL